MRLIIRVVKRSTNDDEALEIKKAIKEALKKYEGVTVNMDTMD